MSLKYEPASEPLQISKRHLCEQLKKAILLEGSPGVGKTTLIEALAKVNPAP